MVTSIRVLACLPLIAAALACASGRPHLTDPAAAPPQPAEAASPRSTADASAELERLRALGYVDYSPERAAPEDRGVTVHDERRSHRGYNLYTVRPLGRTELTDLGGNVLHSWTEQNPRLWTRSLLLDNGDLLVVVFEGGVLHLAWDNRVLARYALRAHHDVRPAPESANHDTAVGRVDGE